MGRPVNDKLAIITIDMQRDTLDGRKLEIKGTSEIVDNLRKVVNQARQKGILIVHIVRIYLEDGSNAEPVRKEVILSGNKILSPGDEGTELFQEVLPEPDIKLDHATLLAGQSQKIGDNEIILYKPRWGAFYNTGLDQTLKKAGIESVCFIGVNFPNCPRTSIYEASERDYQVFAISDAISGIYDQGKKELHNIGVTLLTTEEFSKFLL